MSILQHLSAKNAAPALILPGRVMSYAEVHAQTEELINRLPAERCLVALEAQGTPEFIISYLAVLRANHAAALLPPGDREAFHALNRDFEPDVAISAHSGRWKMDKRIVRAPNALHPDLKLMLATSGSEGRPRWVKLSRNNLESNAASIVSYLGLTAADRAPRTLTFHYSYGLSVLNTHLAAGGSLTFCGESVIEPEFLTNAAELGCTGLSGVPFTFELLERLDFRDRLWPELRYLTVAGGRLSADLVRRYDNAMRAKGGCFFAMYGQTEATARMAYVPPDVIGSNADCIGIAIPGGQLSIRDEAGGTVTESGKSGALVFRGPNVMMGYAINREDLARGPALTELKTGDIATVTPNGLLKLEGRESRFSKIAGIRVGHEAVEWAVRAEGLTCAVTGTDEALTAHVEGAAEGGITALAAAAAGIPARYLSVHTHDALPRLPSGKIDYQALKEAARPETPSAAGTLLQTFQSAFFPRRVTASDSFESLEGDSLSYVQVSLAVENRLGFLPNGWEQIPIGRLANVEPQAAVPRPRWTSRMESHILLRAAAILLIVVHHATLWPIPGGAAALMMMVGYGFARFHRDQLLAGRVGTFLLPMLRNLLPYFAIVAGFAIAWQAIPWASVLLIGNFGFAEPATHTMLPFQFWFVEAYAQLCLMMAALFSFSGVRRAVAARPFEIALAVLLLAFSLRYTIPLVYDIGNRKIFLLSYVLWYAAMGWCAYHAKTTERRILLLVTAALLCTVAAYTGGNWTGSRILSMLQFAVLSILLFLPLLCVPRVAIPSLMLISAASYHIYLFHRVIPEMLGLDQIGSLGPIAAILMGLVCGVGAMSLQRLIFGSLGWRQARAAEAI